MTKTSFPQFERELLSAIEKIAIRRLYKPGELLVGKGKPLHQVFIIDSGCVKMVQTGADGGEFIVCYLKAGESFGESVSEDGPSADKTAPVSIVAIEPTQVLLMSFASKDALARKFDAWYKYLLRMAAMHTRYCIEMIDMIAFQNMEVKIDFFIRRLSNIKQSNYLQISHQEIADGLNTSREVVTRRLKKISDEGKIVVKHGAIEIIS